MNFCAKTKQREKPSSLRPMPKGFTLIELMITIAILAILTTLAAPDFSRFIQKSKIDAGINALDRTLSFARNTALTAIGSGSTESIIICPLDDTGTVPACATTQNYENGWIVFINCDTDYTFDPTETNCSAGLGETLLKVQQTLRGQGSSNGTVITSDTNVLIKFDQTGKPISSTNFKAGYDSVGDDVIDIDKVHGTLTLSAFGRVSVSR